MSAPRGGRAAALADWLDRRFNLTEVFSLLTSFGLFPAEVDASKPLREAVREALARPLPSYARWPRVLGILGFLLFLFLAVTGIMLALYYRPGPEDAFESVTYLVRDVPFGWFVHQTHGWAAWAFVLILLARAWRFFFQGLYKAPREALWIVAVLLFLAATQADLTGRLLPMDALGYWTTLRAMEILYGLPLVGSTLGVLVGGPDVDALVLLRFYLLHVVLLPLLLLVLFYFNFSGVRRLGLSRAPEEGGSGRAAFKVHAYNLLILAVLVFGGLVTLAILAPAPHGTPADPYATPPGAAPPWYLLAAHAFLESFPAMVSRPARGLLLMAVLAAVLLLPFLDRGAGRGVAGRRAAVGAGLAVLALWLLLSWHGWRLEAAP